jgi:hypothetical protein
LIEENYGLSEGLRLILEEHIDEITQKERIPAFDKFGLIGEDVFDVVLEHSLNADKYALVLLFRMHIAQQPQHSNGGINDNIWL